MFCGSSLINQQERKPRQLPMNLFHVKITTFCDKFKFPLINDDAFQTDYAVHYQGVSCTENQNLQFFLTS